MHHALGRLRYVPTIFPAASRIENGPCDESMIEIPSMAADGARVWSQQQLQSM
jgi:hypothetical protein